MPLSNIFAGTPAAAAGRPYLDFGARLYDPRTAAWLSQDPMAEKYYGVSPYAYCAGDPVNLVDPEGCLIGEWKKWADYVSGKTGYHIQRYDGDQTEEDKAHLRRGGYNK